MSLLTADLSTGTISVTVARSTMPPEALFGFAERRNPKRAFLFVSKVLGRHIPVSPAVMRGSYRDLAAMIPADAPGPVLVTGMAETAIGLGAGVHQEYAARRAGDDCVYLATTRHPLGSPLLTEFQEEHSHATRHLLHLPTDPATAALVRTARTLIMVDDEASTGRTFVNLIAALTGAGLAAIEQIYLVTLTDWSAGQALAAMPCPATSIALLHGQYDWTARPEAPLPVMPAVDVTARGQHNPDPALDWGRLGVRRHHLRLAAAATPGERILVLGTGEHVWQPFLLAEALEQQGAEVRYSSVTRSPIAPGHAIGAALSFSDNYGLGIANFVYNIDPAAYDRIILCSETPASALDPVLLSALNPEIIADQGDTAP